MSTPLRSLRILIVDDQPSVADTLALILSHSGHESLAVYSGPEAVNVARTFDPHMVLSDVMMPGMSGIELAAWLTENCPDCKVLLMTGENGAIELAGIDRGHALRVLTKPVMPQTILAFVTKCAEELSMPRTDRQF